MGDGTAGLIGLLLAVIDVFGVAAYAMTQRTREVGIRIALGATGRRVLRMVMLQGARPALIGLVLGTAAALTAAVCYRDSWGACRLSTSRACSWCPYSSPP